MGKSGPNATFDLILSWVGLALGWGFRRFHDHIYMFSKPTEFGKSKKHPSESPLGFRGQTPLFVPLLSSCYFSLGYTLYLVHNHLVLFSFVSLFISLPRCCCCCCCCCCRFSLDTIFVLAAPRSPAPDWLVQKGFPLGIPVVFLLGRTWISTGSTWGERLCCLGRQVDVSTASPPSKR